MRHTGIILLVLLAGTFTAIAQNGESSSEKEAKAEITFTKTTHDFGKIPYKGDGTYKFEFENTGSKPLILTSVNASCGCTSPDWPEKPFKPGEKGEVTVKYNTGIIGKFTKYIYVHSNAKDNSVKLKITGVVKNKNN